MYQYRISRRKIGRGVQDACRVPGSALRRTSHFGWYISAQLYFVRNVIDAPPCLPASFRCSGLTWHFQDTDPDFGQTQAKNLQLHFEQMLAVRLFIAANACYKASRVFAHAGYSLQNKLHAPTPATWKGTAKMLVLYRDAVVLNVDEKWCFSYCRMAGVVRNSWNLGWVQQQRSFLTRDTCAPRSSMRGRTNPCPCVVPVLFLAQNPPMCSCTRLIFT